MRKKLIDLGDPFFAPVWIRVAVVATCLGWGIFEMWARAPLWGVVFLGLGVICAWRFATIDYSTDDKDERDS